MKHFYEDYDKPIQELIKLMNDDFSTNYELVITPVGAEIRSTLTAMVFSGKDEEINDRIKKMTSHLFNEISKQVNEKEK